MNEIASQALVLLRRDIERKGLKKTFQVIHQTGVADEAEVRARYESAGIPARVNAFEHEMGRAFATADLKCISTTSASHPSERANALD